MTQSLRFFRFCESGARMVYDVDNTNSNEKLHPTIWSASTNWRFFKWKNFHLRVQSTINLFSLIRPFLFFWSIFLFFKWHNWIQNKPQKQQLTRKKSLSRLKLRFVYIVINEEICGCKTAWQWFEKLTTPKALWRRTRFFSFAFW